MKYKVTKSIKIISRKVPKVYWEFTSDRVLTMEYCQGIRVDDYEQMKKSKINVNRVKIK